MKTRLSTFILPILILGTASTYAGQAIDETRDAEDDGVIDIELVNADVTISGWDRKQVQVKGELSDAAEGFEFTSRGSITSFEEEYENRRNFFGRNCNNWFNCRGNFDESVLEFFVPRDSTVRLEGVNVELEISDIRGSSEIEIVNGSIDANDLRGRISLETVNGSIETNRLDGRFNLSTVNGRIRDRGSKGDRATFNAVNGSVFSDTRAERVSAENVSGSLELELGDVDDLEASSVSGAIDITLNLMEGGDIEISNVSGRSELLVNRNISARFDINTAVGGNIDNNLTDDKPVRENRFVNSSELQFSLNGGAGNVDISSVTGNIRIGTRD